MLFDDENTDSKNGLNWVGCKEILKEFAARHQIESPLLADPGSKIIERFHVLNEEAAGMTKGMSHPGYFYVDRGGMILEKCFVTKYTDRFTPNNLIGKLFPELSEEAQQNVAAPHIGLSIAQTDGIAASGSRVSLIAGVELPRDVPVYSPGVTGYTPIELAIAASPDVELASVTSPESKILYLEAIKERVPVFEGKFRITQDVTVARSREFAESLGTLGKTITVAGELKYQACDKTTCYVPTSVPVKWELQILPLDRERSPEAIRHK